LNNFFVFQIVREDKNLCYQPKEMRKNFMRLFYPINLASRGFLPHSSRAKVFGKEQKDNPKGD
jgi:hypothetical protein